MCVSVSVSMCAWTHAIKLNGSHVAMNSTVLKVESGTSLQKAALQHLETNRGTTHHKGVEPRQGASSLLPLRLAFETSLKDLTSAGQWYFSSSAGS